jgi:amino acid transporter
VPVHLYAFFTPRTSPSAASSSKIRSVLADRSTTSTTTLPDGVAAGEPAGLASAGAPRGDSTVAAPVDGRATTNGRRPAGGGAGAHTEVEPPGDGTARAGWRPERLDAQRASRPSSRRDRLKDRMLGPVLPNEALAHERLGKSTALAVFSSDALSSTAYATEEILRTFFAAGVGALAFSYVLPITTAMVVVLAILMFSYRQTIKAYPSAGGAYIVTKDNLGLLPAQVAGVALLTDYVLTVAVSVSAGTAALYSYVPATYAWRVPIALVFIALIAWGNLRGVKESGRLFAAPTYGFILMVLLTIVVGLVRSATGHLPTLAPADPAALAATGSVGLFLVLHAFASGGAAMTGVEAISNGVPAFRPPEWRNARATLMVMGTLLGVMFLGLSWLGKEMQAVPSEQKTVISQIARGVLGGGIPFLVFQLCTLLILVLAANTSFADFPRLASFHAEDAFMPRQLTKRGHRLAFSNGIIFLACAAGFLVVLFGADVTHLIPLYAIGVFTSFTLSQAGMAVRHIRLREPSWRLGLVINGGGAVATGVVTIVIGLTKFTHGAWAIMLLVPLLVIALVRLNHQYESEAEELNEGAAEMASAPVAPRRTTLVLVDQLDRAAAQAIRAARSQRAEQTEVVHIALDHRRADQLRARWAAFGNEQLDLRIVDCPDRRLAKAAAELALEVVDGGTTELNVLLPRVIHRRIWHRLLHDRTSEVLAEALSRLPHVTVTFVPYRLGRVPDEVPQAVASALAARAAQARDDLGADAVRPAADVQSIGEARWREQVTIEGTVVECLHERLEGASPAHVLILSDGTGRMGLAFVGRDHIAGLDLGARVRATGRVGQHRRRLALLNPSYQLVEPAFDPHAALPAH